MQKIKTKALEFYEKHEIKFDIAFFLGGVLFDLIMVSEIDDTFAIVQQVFYLFIMGTILYFEFLIPLGVVTLSERVQKIWNYRQLVFHFFMGTLLNIYSIFYIKSSSFFSSLVFILFLIGLMIANEMKSVRKSEINIKLGIYIICVLSFFSMMIPVLLGHVGLLPFLIAVGLTVLCLFGVTHLLIKKTQNRDIVLHRFVFPGGTVILLFILFYVMGWIPPVPLSVKNMGVYHKIEKSAGQYTVYYENPWWKFWNTGDQEFTAQPGDKIYFFAKIFSPAKFSDSVILHWYFKEPKIGWQSTDKIPMQVNGGRENGWRGFSVKQNYSPGEWRVSVETTDQREIGRLYFNVEMSPIVTERIFLHEQK